MRLLHCILVIIPTLVFRTVESTDPTHQNINLIIETLKKWTDSSPSASLFVTVAFAQTLDGRLAAMSHQDNNNKLSSNFAISGKESLVLTHALRSIHDGILVGGRTLFVDNPRLTNRLFPSVPHSPRPIVIDTNLTYIQKLGNKRRLVNPIVCCSRNAAHDVDESHLNGCELLPCRTLASGRLDLTNVLYQLQSKYGLRSIMVEGGPTLLSALLRERLVDAACVTVSPKILGCGLGLSCTLSLTAPLYVPLGKDVTVLSRMNGNETL